MSSIAVRDHLPTGIEGPVNLQALRATESASGPELGPSLRELLERLRGFRLELANVRFHQLDVPGLNHVLTAIRNVAGGGVTRIRIRLEVWVDGEYERSLHLGVTDSGSYGFEEDPGTIAFRDAVVLRLYEANLRPYLAHPAVAATLAVLPLPDEVISHTIDATGRDDLTFTGVAGSYRLPYRVTREPGRPPTAQELIAGFRARTGTGRWPELDRATLADEMEATIADPALVQQGPTPLCGPASVIHSLALRAPRRYVRAVAEMFDHGGFTTKTGHIPSTPSLRAAEVPTVVRDDGRTSAIRQVDWILAGAMRNHENLFLRVEGATPDLAGITLAGAVTTWIRELLGYERVVISKATTTAGFGFSNVQLLGIPGLVIAGLDVIGGLSASQALADGKRALASGGEAYMLINDKLLGSNPSDPRVWMSVVPNWATHWIALREPAAGHPINITHDGEVQFTAFTWGRWEQVRVSQRLFDRHTFLVVTAHPAPT